MNEDKIKELEERIEKLEKNLKEFKKTAFETDKSVMHLWVTFANEMMQKFVNLKTIDNSMKLQEMIIDKYINEINKEEI